ncbi:MAG: tRNA (guanosine(46)-N7)-methyltransferase TrmB, partial [Mariprofundaceae bacterium]
GGFIRLATDKPELAEWMRDILDAEQALENSGGVGGFIQRDPTRPFTKFEMRGQLAGEDSIFLEYRRKAR